VNPFQATRLLLDPDRLAVAGALVVAPMTTDELAAATRLDRKRVLLALGDLRGAGLVSTKDGQYWLEADTLRAIAQEAAELEIPMDPVIGFGMTDEEGAVLSRYFSGRTLIEIPTNRPKRQVLLQRLVLEFDVGRRYTEQEVNDVLFAFYPDWSTLRRYLIDEGLLDRTHADGVTTYWRAGGRVLDMPTA